MNLKSLARFAVMACASMLVACANSAESSPQQPEAQTARQDQSGVPAALTHVVVYKNASCGCCTLWIEHMEKAGFEVDARDVDNMNPVKESAGIPPALGSCHTARVGDYFIEGHVPASDVKRLLAQRPRARGLTVPGMPIGSPGMEASDGRVQPYDVLLVAPDGSTSVFAHHSHR